MLTDISVAFSRIKSSSYSNCILKYFCYGSFMMFSNLPKRTLTYILGLLSRFVLTPNPLHPCPSQSFQSLHENKLSFMFLIDLRLKLAYRPPTPTWSLFSASMLTRCSLSPHGPYFLISKFFNSIQTKLEINIFLGLLCRFSKIPSHS